MKKEIQFLPSGIPIVDNNWGGFYRGSSYLLIGAQKTGRTLLSLQFALENTLQKEVCLYFTSKHPKDLIIQAASFDFDLQHYMDANKVILVRVAPPASEEMFGNNDKYLVDYITDIVRVVEQYNTSKIVFDELTSFVEFNNRTLLESTLANVFKIIEDLGITSLFVLRDPANDITQGIVDSVTSFSSGVLYLKKEDEEDNKGQMTITPNVDHKQGQFTCSYKLDAYKGVVIDILEENSVTTRNLNKNNVAKWDN